MQSEMRGKRMAQGKNGEWNWKMEVRNRSGAKRNHDERRPREGESKQHHPQTD